MENSIKYKNPLTVRYQIAFLHQDSLRETDSNAAFNVNHFGIQRALSRFLLQPFL